MDCGASCMRLFLASLVSWSDIVWGGRLVREWLQTRRSESNGRVMPSATCEGGSWDAVAVRSGIVCSVGLVVGLASCAFDVSASSSPTVEASPSALE